MTKLIHHAIRIAARNTTRSLARAIVSDTGHARADDEAHTLIRTALAGSRDIISDHHTVYPGTALTLRYSVKSHRGPHTNYRAMSGVLMMPGQSRI